LTARRLRVQPCIPSAWPGFEITYRRGNTAFHIVVDNPARVQRGVREVTCDGRVLPGLELPLAEDGGTHEVRVTMG
jgi:cellobiose phosphorylase